MRKTVRMFATMALAILLLAVAVCPVMAEGFDFDSAIAAFKPSAVNTYELEVGKTHKPNTSVWMESGVSNCYSSDETVATVSSAGEITAVAEGTAYVAFTSGTLVEVYRYDIIPSNDTGDMVVQQPTLDSSKDVDAGKNNQQILLVILIIVAVLLAVGGMAYVYVTAPKSRMNRFWMLAPLFGNVIGLLLFVAVRSANRAKRKKKRHNRSR